MQLQQKHLVSGRPFAERLTWGSNVILLSILIPRSFSRLLLGRDEHSNFSYCVRKTMWLIWISVSYLNKVLYYFSRSHNTLLKFYVSWAVGVIICVVGNSRLGKNWNKSYKNVLNSSGLSIEPCGTLKIIPDHELYVPFTFTLCFRLVKCECNSFKKRYQPHKAWSLAINNTWGKQSKALKRSVELQRHHLRYERYFLHF